MLTVECGLRQFNHIFVLIVTTIEGEETTSWSREAVSWKVFGKPQVVMLFAYVVDLAVFITMVGSDACEVTP